MREQQQSILLTVSRSCGRGEVFIWKEVKQMHSETQQWWFLRCQVRQLCLFKPLRLAVFCLIRDERAPSHATQPSSQMFAVPFDRLSRL